MPEIDFLSWNYKDVIQNEKQKMSSRVVLNTSNKKGIHLHQLKIELNNPLDFYDVKIERLIKNKNYVEDKNIQFYLSGLEKNWLHLKDIILVKDFSLSISLRNQKFFMGFSLSELNSEIQMWDDEGHLFIPKFDFMLDSRKEYNI